MKVTTDGCLFGAWCAEKIAGEPQTARPTSALDIGAGTGLLSLMLAQKAAVPIEAIEVDDAAFQQAQKNVAASPWKEKIFVTNADVLHWRPEGPFQYILSNPPFYENDLKSPTQQKNVAHHNDGLTLLNLLHFIELHLSSDGFFFLLLPAKREKEFTSLLSKTALHLHRLVYVRQSVHHKPFRLLLQGAKTNTAKTSLEDMAIKTADGVYTAAFIHLLKDYYLHL